MLPYDNTRDHDVSLRELYGAMELKCLGDVAVFITLPTCLAGQAEEYDNIKVTWLTGEASSETSSEVAIPCTSGRCTALD